MNCPNCNKQPMGFVHYLKLGKVGFSKSILGYFRCQHCDFLLKQQRYGGVLTKFDIKYWIILPLIFAMVVILPDLLTNFITYLFPGLAPEIPLLSSGEQISPIIIIYGIIFFVTLLTAFVIFFQSMFRFMKFKAADESNQSKDEIHKISPIGWVIFTAFLIAYLLTGYLILQNSELFTGYGWLYTAAFVVYLFILIGVSALIAENFSKLKAEDK